MSYSGNIARGWFRLASGRGVAWKLWSDPRLFSERHGYRRWVSVLWWRVRVLEAA